MKKIQTFMEIEPKVTLALAIIAAVFILLDLKISAYIIIGFIILFVILYFIISLKYWKCPNCHAYLPTKKAGSITKCPNCKKSIY